jgi:hypothetical protein
MTIGTYAVVWIDQEDARCIFLDADAIGDNQLRAEHIRSYHRARAGNQQERRATDDHVFYQKIANDLAPARKFLLIGPAGAKAQFVRHLHRYDPRLIVRLRTMESTERLSDEELVTTAQEYFQCADRPLTRHEAQWSI